MKSSQNCTGAQSRDVLALFWRSHNMSFPRRASRPTSASATTTTTTTTTPLRLALPASPASPASPGRRSLEVWGLVAVYHANFPYLLHCNGILLKLSLPPFS